MNQDKTLPCGWSFALLKQVLKKLVDGSHNPPPKQEYGFPMLSARNIENGQINFNDYRFIEQKAFETENKRTQVHPGDVLLTIVGAIGRTATVPDNIDLFTLQRSVAVLSPVGMIPDFLMYQLQSPQVQKELLKEAKGTAQKGIYLKTLGGIPVLIPPLNEQRRIVAKIEALKARSQRVKEALEDIPQLLDQFRQSVLAAAFRGDLTADWREQNPDVEPVSELLKRVRDKRKMQYEEECVKAKVEGKRKPKKPTNLEPEIRFSDSEIDISPTWIWTSFEDISSIKEHSMSSGPFGSALGTKDYRDSGIPVIRGQNVQNGRFVLKNFVYISGEKALELKRSKAYPGDIVIVAVGAGAGNAAIVPYDLPESILSQNCNKFTIDEYLAIPEYIMLVLQIQIFKVQIQEIITDTARQFLSLTNLKEIIFPIPPLEEQKEIARLVQSFFKISEQIEQKYYEVKTYIDQLDQSILAKAFRGELVPQDPNDEPASVLLERIRAEREKLQTKAAKKSTPQTGGRRSKKALQQDAEPVQLELGLE